ncbi:MAG TPA: 3-dehydroquinate synthase [Nitrospiraceae bacterium]|nr:3-dehydroquinate synthase [Nitrospiraceae bacterium]
MAGVFTMSIEEQCVKVPLAERSYDIVIRSGLLAEVGPRLRALGFSGKAAVVTDEAVGRRYAMRLRRSLTTAGFQPHVIVVPAGERAKTQRWVSRILDELVKERFERAAPLLALGGGVVGDLAGFAAAVFARGMPFIQIPTTLVAQVDSSIGGKTGINHPLGKNLIGAFHQPRLVLIDPETLQTLPSREWVAGLAEVIKYGVIADEDFFAYLEGHMGGLLKLEEQPVVRVITRSCQIKASVVAEDERESNRRRILNYGHTVGHALESLGRYRRLVHGEAVAIGMVQEADLSRYLGFCTDEVVTRQRALVRQAGLPDALTPVRFTELWNAMQHDKKVSQGQLHCVLPERIGAVRIAPLERTAVKNWFARRTAKGNHNRHA